MNERKQKIKKLFPGNWTSGKQERSLENYYYLVFSRNKQNLPKDYLCLTPTDILVASYNCIGFFNFLMKENIFDASSEEIRLINVKIKKFKKIKNFI